MYCIVCGEEITNRRLVSWSDIRNITWNPLRHGKIAICLKSSCDVFFRKTVEKAYHLSSDENMYVDGYCSVCGEILVINFNRYKRMYNHRRCREKQKQYKRPSIDKLKNASLKPWEDPESLFCDTDFLQDLIGKEISTGDECRGK